MDEKAKRQATEGKLEQPKETCGLMLVFKGGVSTQVNLAATKQEVIDIIQDNIIHNLDGLIQFKTSNPDEQEICLFDPKELLVVMVKKEFVMASGKIISASMGENPNKFRH